MVPYEILWNSVQCIASLQGKNPHQVSTRLPDVFYIFGQSSCQTGNMSMSQELFHVLMPNAVYWLCTLTQCFIWLLVSCTFNMLTSSCHGCLAPSSPLAATLWPLLFSTNMTRAWLDKIPNPFLPPPRFVFLSHESLTSGIKVMKRNPGMMNAILH